MKDYTEAVQQVLDGLADPIEVFANIKQDLDLLNKCKEQIEEYAMKEAEKFGKNFEYKGFKIELRDGGRNYSFKNIKEWVDKTKEVKEIEEKAKAAYSSYEKGLQTANADGEIMELPEVTFRKASIIVKKLN